MDIEQDHPSVLDLKVASLRVGQPPPASAEDPSIRQLVSASPIEAVENADQKWLLRLLQRLYKLFSSNLIWIPFYAAGLLGFSHLLIKSPKMTVPGNNFTVISMTIFCHILWVVKDIRRSPKLHRSGQGEKRMNMVFPFVYYEGIALAHWQQLGGGIVFRRRGCIAVVYLAIAVSDRSDGKEKRREGKISQEAVVNRTTLRGPDGKPKNDFG